VNGPRPSVGLYWYADFDPTTGAGMAAPLNQLLVRTDTPSLYYKSGFANTAWTLIGTGGGGGGAVAAFTYTCTGSEDPDGFVVPLPTPRADTNFVAVAQCAGVTDIFGIDVPQASNTTTTITVRTTTTPTEGDVIAFVVSEI
jgi:hypothetical protein